MPTVITFYPELVVLAHKLTLTAALLSSWDHEGSLLGEYSMQDALRMDTQRQRFVGIEPALIGGAL